MSKMLIVDVAPESIVSQAAPLVAQETEKPVVEVKTVAKFASKEAYLDILAKHMIPYKVQSGFLRIDGPAGSRLYVANTKTVRRVDISGFETSWTIAKIPHCGPFGAVKQQLQMDGSVEEQLARFELLVHDLLSQPAKEKTTKSIRAEEKIAASES